MRRNILLLASGLLILLLVLSTGCSKKQTEGPIGGETDEHGCLIAAGFSWSDDVGACIREWELDDNAKQAARIVVEPLAYDVTVVKVEALECEGCFDIIIQRNDNDEALSFSLVNWEVDEGDETIFCPEDAKMCPDGSFVVRNPEYNCEFFPCPDDAHICTDEEKAAELCTMDYNPVCGDDDVTYGNACAACASNNIDYWTKGECPEI